MIKLHPSKRPTARRLKRQAALGFLGAFILLMVLISIFRWYEFDKTASPVSWAEVGMLTILGIVGICLGVAGGVYAYESGCAGRMERGEGLHARWTVDAPSWRELGERRRILDQAPGAIITYPPMPAEAPPEGVEIIICEDGIFIGPEFSHPLPPISVLQARLTDRWLELDCLEDMPTHILRVPVPSSAMSQVLPLLARLKTRS
ncbi:hypothetical protein [Brevifollis gellanilyticus]|nr:hypothetical protein [Brevifollis gellanilyticus]